MADSPPIAESQGQAGHAGLLQGPDGNPLIASARQLVEGMTIPAGPLIATSTVLYRSADGLGSPQQGQYGIAQMNQSEGTILELLRAQLLQAQVTNALLRLQLEENAPGKGYIDMSDDLLSTSYANF